MNILAIDIGEHGGVAKNRWADDAPLVALSFHVTSQLALYNFLDDVSTTPYCERAELLVYEDAFAQPGKAGARFHEKVGVIKLWCEQNNVPYIGVPVLTWHNWARKFTGFAPRPKMPKLLRLYKRIKKQKGPYNKAEMKRLERRHERNKRKYNKLFKLHLYHEAMRRSGLGMPNNNASDAWWVLQYFIANRDKYEGIG